MPWPCFLVERVNERVIPHACDEPDCDGHDEHRFDIARADTGEILKHDVEYFHGDLPIGAMWFGTIISAKLPTGPQDWTGYTDAEKEAARQRATEHPEWYPQGIDAATGLPNLHPSHTFEHEAECLYVQTPGGVWNIDSRASNCAEPFDYEHRCWVKHGEPPAITVDKAGRTCAAGGGSIQCGIYHGFLQNGALTDG